MLKKLGFFLLLCCLFSTTIYAKNVYYKSYTDSTSGRRVEYFDLDGDNTERLYFTQSYWLKDSDAFVVSSVPESMMYKYDIATHTVQALHGDDIKCNDVGITRDNIMYMRNIVSGSEEPRIYRKDLNENSDNKTVQEISAVVNADGTGFDGELSLKRWYDLSLWPNSLSYDRMIIFSGETGKPLVDGKTYSYNEEYYECKKGPYQRWRNSWYFEVPDDFLYGTDYDTVEIEIEYYATASSALSLFVHSDNTKYTTNVETGKWTTKVFTISRDDGKGATFDNGWYDEVKTFQYADFRFMFESAQAYVHSVKLRKITDNSITNLGKRPWGYQIHTTADGKYLSLTGDADYQILVYDIENNTWEQFKKVFPSPNTVANHVMINPVYPNLVLFAHEGDATQVFDRMWIYDRDTKEFYNVFKQYSNIENQYTGEAVGHESWTADGESIVAVKYKKNYNVGKSGIIRMNKYGGEREYLNDDYDYWHCSPSPDGRWIVADTLLTNSKTKIVLIDSKTGKSYVVAEPKAANNDPWQPHPQFSPDGKKVTFGMIYRQKNNANVLGVGMVDVSSLVDDGQYTDELYMNTNEKQGFLVSPFSISFNGGLSNTVSTTITNLDNKPKVLSLYVAVYDADGRLVSLGSNQCNTNSNIELSSSFSWVNGASYIRCFLWDDEGKPILTSTTPVEKLCVAKTSANSVVLTWQPSNNLTDISYEVYRNGTRIWQTADLVYRDANLTKETEYLYEVKPVYTNAFLTDDNSCVSITPTYNGGVWSVASNIVSGPMASVRVKTSSTTTTSSVSSGYQSVSWSVCASSGLSLLGGGTTVDSFKRLSSSSQWLTFNVADIYLCTSAMNMAWIDITYKDVGYSEIYLEYNTSDPTASSSQKSHKRANDIIKCTNTGKLITKRFALIDVDFSLYDGYDFRIGTNSNAYINSVRVLGY